MKHARWLALLWAATGWQAAAQTWDTSGNGMLNGTYYFREVVYFVGYDTGGLDGADALYGTISFNGNGTYTFTNCSVYDYTYGPGTCAEFKVPTSGTYSIAASGYGFLSSPIPGGGYVYGLVSQQNIFVGSSTESGFNDLFIAAPLSSPAPTAATFKGSYWFADMDLSYTVSESGPLYAIGYTYSEAYSVSSNGTYSNPGIMNYVVGADGVRIGSGIGPYLGINVALPAPGFSGSGVFINPAGVVNTASFAPFTAGIAPGDFISIFGTNLAPGTATAYTVPFPTTAGLDGVQVTVNGLPAPVQFVSPGQISAIVPYAIGSSIAQIQVNNNGVLSNVVTEFMNLTAPGVFTVPPGGVGDGAVLHADYSLVTAQSPAQVGETVAVYLTGLGTVNPLIQDGSAGVYSQTNSTIAVYIGGQAAAVGYSGLAPDLAGLYQLNVTVPSGVTTGDNTLEIVGPDSDADEAQIPVGSSQTTSAVSAPQPALRKLPRSAPPARRQRTSPISSLDKLNLLAH